MEKLNKNNFLYFSAILLLIILEPYTYISMYKVSQELAFGAKVLAILAFCFVFIVKRKSFRMSVKKHMFMLLFIGTLLFNKLITQDNSGFYFTLCATIAIAYLATGILKFDQFKEAYSRVLSFLCIYSVITTYVIIFMLQYFQWLPFITHYIGDTPLRFVDVGFNFVYIPDYIVQYRNFSIFREPGVFQFYIIIALIFEMWFKNGKTKNSRIFIYSTTLITTFSTVGVILGMGIISIYILRSMKNYKGVLKVMFGILLSAVSFYMILRYIPFVKENLELSLNKITNGGISTASRSGSLKAYFSAWLEKPFLGWGYSKGVFEAGGLYLRQYTNDNTNTTFTNLAFFGLIYGFLYQFFLIKFAFLSKHSLLIKLFIAALFVLSINTQRFIDSTLIFMLIFYSINGFENKSKKETNNLNNHDGKVILSSY